MPEFFFRPVLDFRTIWFFVGQADGKNGPNQGKGKGFMSNNAQQHVQACRSLLDTVKTKLAGAWSENGRLSAAKLDENQVVGYNFAWLLAEVSIAEHFLNYAASDDNGTGELEGHMAAFFAGETVNHVRTELLSRLGEYQLSAADIQPLMSDETTSWIQEATSTSMTDKIADLVAGSDTLNFGSYALNEYHETFAETFRKFAEDKVRPLAEKVHRENLDIPQEIIDELAGQGCFGLSIPDKFGGFLEGGQEDNTSMMVVTEELSRGSLGVAGSLITRPEILSKAILKGGTEEQKEKFLPQLASGEKMAGVMVTEPNFGSNVAGLSVTATPTDGGWLINGVKTWCTFAGYAELLLVLCRTDPDKSAGHKGLSILIAEKPKATGHHFEHKQEGGGTIEGRAIDTIGYRGMHSYEVNFDNYFVPAENLIGMEEGQGKGFYFQMAGFAGGRLQTAARANGVMQAALEKGIQYAKERQVFDQPIFNYSLTKFKIAKMAAITQASRQYSNHVAQLMDEGKGDMEATLIKFYASKIAEWVTRESMQIHGGMGYAEEYEVSRLFVDARVFSIFEGAEEVMALKVITRGVLAAALKGV
jgi:(2S)-methylsuccinyl-CoA dehydrogenase